MFVKSKEEVGGEDSVDRDGRQDGENGKDGGTAKGTAKGTVSANATRLTNSLSCK
jgi:hypothetical protein